MNTAATVQPSLAASRPATDSALACLADWQRDVRAQFPILIDNPSLIYLDSAATSQKPRAVLDAVNAYLRTGNANAGRGSYGWAHATTVMVESTKERVKNFIGDLTPSSSTVEFVSGTSEGLRRIALDWLAALLRDGDEIIWPERDHEANAAPWREAVELAASRGISIVARAMPYDSAGDYDFAALAAMVNEHTRFVAMTHVHHVNGVDMEVAKVRAAIGPDVVLCLDAAQSFGHLPVSVAACDVDFLVFSGHKAMALPGTGAVWARNQRGPVFTSLGWSGTPNTVGVVSLSAALDWLDATGMPVIERYLAALTARLEDGLRAMENIEFVGCEFGCRIVPDEPQRHGIVAFRCGGIPAGDLGFALESHGVMVRANSHCQAGTGAQQGSVRASLHAYTTVEEIDRFLLTLAGLLD